MIGRHEPMHELERRFLDTLLRSEAVDRDHLRAYQRRLLEPLVRHAAATTPFYRDRLAGLMRPDGAFDFARWSEVPLFTRRDALAAGAALYASSVPTSSGAWRDDQTSGSTGIPFRHRRSDLADIASACQTERDYIWFGLDLDAAVANIAETWDGTADWPEGRIGGSWNLRGNGELHLLDVRTAVAHQYDWLQRRRPAYLMTHPSLVKALARHAVLSRDGGLRFDAILTLGEVVSGEVREMAMDAFGARILDRYGAQEIGHMATECPLCSHYHVSAETVLVELLRADGTPAAPGEIGRVVVTSFYNYAMPFIRYDIGDFAEAGPANGCRRTLPAIRRLLGRERNVFVMADGSIYWPDTRSYEMVRFLDFTQYQVVQTTPEDIEVRFVPPPSGARIDQAGLQAYFRTVLHPSVNVTARAVDRIDRSPSGKYEDYVSLVAAKT